MSYDPNQLGRAMRELHDYWHQARDGRRTPRIGLERWLRYERLLLPLSEDDKTVNMLLGCTIVRPVLG